MAKHVAEIAVVIVVLIHTVACNLEKEYISNLPDSSLTGSSQLSIYNGYNRSRLNTQAETAFHGAWSAAINAVDQYIQADLGEVRRLVRIAIQGHNNVNNWVTTYHVAHSLDGLSYDFVLDGTGNPHIFTGNNDSDTIVETTFNTSFLARYIRVYPQTWNNHISMRWGVFGHDLVAQSSNSNPFFTTTCTDDTECNAAHMDSVCETDATSQQDRCRCPDKYIPFDTSDSNNPKGKCVQLNRFSLTDCTKPEDCESAGHRNAICVERNIEMDGNETNTIIRCSCRDNAMFSNLADPDNSTGICQLQAELSELCDTTGTPPESVCVEENSSCKDDGYNQGTSRCLCNDGFILFDNTDMGKQICAKILRAQEYPLCSHCEGNDGTCFATTSNVTLLEEDFENNYQCKCPITQVRSAAGVDCGKSLVDVKCDASNFTMTVCYEPHESIVNEDFVMYADEFGRVEACKGQKIDPHNNLNVHGCPEGSERKLVLELRSDKLTQCGVEEYTYAKKKEYQKKIVVKNDPDMSSLNGNGEYYFDVFCSMSTQHGSAFNPFEVANEAGNDQGEHLEPTLTFTIRNELNQVVTPGMTLRVGDLIRLMIVLDADGTYSGTHVLRCTASSSPKIPDEKAVTVPLLQDSCPAAIQTIFTEDNVFKRVSNQPNVLETGPVQVFKLSGGSETFIHCTVKLCLVGDEDECGPVPCGNANSAGKRRKRSTEQQKHLVMKLPVENEEANSSNKIVMNTAGFALMLTILLVFLIVLAVLVVLLYLKLRRRGSYVEDIGAPPNKPQRFALPRIGNAAMRM